VRVPAAIHRTGSRSPSCTLRINDKLGAGVPVLAQTLKFCYGATVTTNKFDATTRAALKRVQRAHGLTADGIFGPATLKAMNWRLFRTSRPGVQSSGCHRPLVSRTISPAPAPGDYSPYCAHRVRFRTGRPDWSGMVPGAWSRTVTGRNSFNCFLKLGDYGAGVKTLQEVLRSCYRSQIATDGRYGPRTRTAVKRVQQTHGLPADGIFGPATLRAMKWRLYFFDGRPSINCHRLTTV
jgi:hypothetical protein